MPADDFVEPLESKTTTISSHSSFSEVVYVCLLQAMASLKKPSLMVDDVGHSKFVLMNILIAVAAVAVVVVVVCVDDDDDDDDDVSASVDLGRLSTRCSSCSYSARPLMCFSWTENRLI